MIWTRQHTVFLVVALAFVAVVIGLAVPLATCRDGAKPSGATFGETGAFYYARTPQRGYASFLGHKRPYGPYSKQGFLKKHGAAKSNGPRGYADGIQEYWHVSVELPGLKNKSPMDGEQKGEGLLGLLGIKKSPGIVQKIGDAALKKRSAADQVTSADMYKTYVSPNNKLAHVPQTKPPYAGKMDLNDAPKEEDISHVHQLYDKPRMLQQQYKAGVSSKDLFVGGPRRKFQSDLAMRAKQRTKK